MLFITGNKITKVSLKICNH